MFSKYIRSQIIFLQPTTPTEILNIITSHLAPPSSGFESILNTVSRAIFLQHKSKNVPFLPNIPSVNTEVHTMAYNVLCNLCPNPSHTPPPLWPHPLGFSQYFALLIPHWPPCCFPHVRQAPSTLGPLHWLLPLPKVSSPRDLPDYLFLLLSLCSNDQKILLTTLF